MRKKYGHIISLGYNCEVSFQFFLKYHFVESSLFAWVATTDCQHVIAALKDLSVLTTKGFKKVLPMYEDLATGISFHTKESFGDTEEEIQQELKDRVLYLKDKFIKTASDGKKNLYIFKYPPIKRSENLVRKDILALHKVLTNMVSNEFDLLIIMEQDMYPDLSFDIANLYLRRVKFFTKPEAVTDKPYDKKHFNKIFSEFRPDFKLPKTKHFKFEDTGRKTSYSDKRKKYDFIFSMGAACSCTAGLRAAGLQIASYPFDWLFGSDFCGRADIVVSEFERFIEKDDLEYAFSERSIKCDAYHNKYNDLTFNHDFEKDKDLAETYPAVREKYNRRINRLLGNIAKSDRILMVYMETPNTKVIARDKDIIEGFRKIQRHFPDKHIDLAYISPHTTHGPFIRKDLSEHITRFFGNYKDPDVNSASYAVNDGLVKHFFAKNYKFNQPLSVRVKKKVLRTLIQLVPSHNKRVNLRKKYHME